MVRTRVWRGPGRHNDFWTQQNLFTLEFTAAVITYTRSVQYQASQHSGMETGVAESPPNPSWGAVDYCWFLRKRESCFLTDQALGRSTILQLKLTCLGVWDSKNWFQWVLF